MKILTVKPYGLISSSRVEPLDRYDHLSSSSSTFSPAFHKLSNREESDCYDLSDSVSDMGACYGWISIVPPNDAHPSMPSLRII